METYIEGGDEPFVEMTENRMDLSGVIWELSQLDLVPVEETPAMLFNRDMRNKPESLDIIINDEDITVVFTEHPLKVPAINVKLCNILANEVIREKHSPKPSCRQLKMFKLTIIDLCKQYCFQRTTGYDPSEDQECKCPPILYIRKEHWEQISDTDISEFRRNSCCHFPKT